MAKKTKSKRAVSSSSKKTNPKKLQPKKIVRGSSRYRAVQQLLSAQAKSSGLKLGKNFNKVAGEIYRKTQGHPLKFVEQNFEQIWKEHGAAPIIIPIDFPDDFPFYYFMDKLTEPQFDEVTVSVSFTDAELNLQHSGSSEEIKEYYANNLHRHLRKNYGESPVAIFKIVSTDNKTYVDYSVITNVEYAPGEQEEPPLAKEEETTAEETLKGGGGFFQEKELEIQLEKEKQKTAELEIKKSELSLKKAEQALELIKAGFTKEEIIKILG